jgi:hypothetical protein
MGLLQKEAEMLNQNNAERLCKILGMLGSDHPGERDTAARMASRMLSDLSLTWAQVIVAPAPSIVPQRPRPHGASTDTWRRMALYCHNRRWSLTAAEQRFVADMVNHRSEPSERQADWLCAIYDRVLRACRGRV